MRKVTADAKKRIKALRIMIRLILAGVFCVAGAVLAERETGEKARKEGTGSHQTASVPSDSKDDPGITYPGFRLPSDDGSGTAVCNGDVPYFDLSGDGAFDPGNEADMICEKKGASFYYYSKHDARGRSGAAAASLLDPERPAEEREDISSIRPSGWHFIKLPDVIDTKPPYLYHRCHLVMRALGGKDGAENLITGTEYMNRHTMFAEEEKVLRYVRRHPDERVFYRVTPYYKGDEVVARGALIEAGSENGALSLCRFVFNVQPGVEIDYATGAAKRIREPDRGELYGKSEENE